MVQTAADNHLPDIIHRVGLDFPDILHKFQFFRGPQFDVYDLPEDIKSIHTPPNSELPTDIQQISNYLIKELAGKNISLLNRRQMEILQLTSSIHRHKQQFVRCLAGTIDGVIYENGYVAFCENTLPFASLKGYNYNFFKLWHSREANETRKKIQRCFCTHPCNLSTSMAFDPASLKRITANRWR